jgi:hypothetical protein
MEDANQRSPTAMVSFPQQRNNAIPPQPAFSGSGPVAIGRFIAPVAGKTLSRGGAAMASLLGHWAAIAGPALAAHTLPAKMTKASSGPASASAPSTLLLKVDPAKALEVQYAIPQLIERVNQTLGYKAIAGVRLIQVPVLHGPKKRSPAAAPMPQGPAADKANRLGAALARMAAGLHARGHAAGSR